MCKCRRFSLCLVAALAGVLVGNIFLLVMLLRSDAGNGPTTVSSQKFLSPDVTARTNKTYLTLKFLRSTLDPSKRIPNVKSQHSIRFRVTKLKWELESPEDDYAELIETAAQWVTPSQIVPTVAPKLGSVLKYLRKAAIIRASVPKVGTQLKVMLTLDQGQKALFKPQWFKRDHIIKGHVYTGEDRHNGEIVAFYLGLLLDLRRTPITVGRRVNISKDIWSKADADLAVTFRKEEQNGTCFYGVCRYCKPHLSVCAPDDIMEGAVILWLPNHVKLKKFRSPWQRTYKEHVEAPWEKDDAFCSKLQEHSSGLYTVNKGSRRLLDLIESSIFDFLINNGDRHHYEVIDGSSEASVLLLDNGKSFGRPDIDYLDILAPLYQCCKLRKSFYQKLNAVEQGPLSALMKEITKGDDLYPLLTDDHLHAMDRRLSLVMQTVELCIQLDPAALVS